MKYLLIISLVIVSACSSNKIKPLDTNIDIKGTTSNGVLGLQNNEAVIQEKRKADDELRLQEWSNFQLENELNHEHYMVMWCYEDLADPRLGGNGEMPKTPEIMNMKNSVAIKEELGLEGTRLMVVKTSSFKERLEVERSYEKSLIEMTKLVKQSRKDCERKMTVARLKAGLPGKRYQGKITVDKNGHTDTVIQQHEHNLDDAFNIKEKSKPQPSQIQDRQPASIIEDGEDVKIDHGHEELKNNVMDLMSPK